jgi:hypothetical protein
MKKYVRGFLATIVSVCYLSSAAVGAQSSGCAGATITNTGPNSTNTITCVDSSTVSVTCVNNVFTVTNNSQTSNTGGANNSGNTTGGGSITGNATNSNGQTVQIGASCDVPSTTTTTTTPSTGLGEVEGTSTTKVAALPYTAKSSIATWVVAVAAGLAGLVGLSRLAVLAYRHSLLK